MGPVTLSHLDLCNILLEVDRNEQNVSCLMSYVNTIYPDLDQGQLSLVEQKLNVSFLRVFKMKLSSVFYKEDVFRKKNHEWLSGNVLINLEKCVSVGGRPSLDNYEDSSKSTKRRKILLLTDTYSEEEIKQAFYKKVRDSGKKHLIPIIESLLSDDKCNLLTFTEAESLALIEDAKLSRWQYDTIRKRSKEKNADIFIPYKKLGEAKTECYPTSSSISITEKHVSINLQALLDHTCERLLKVPTIISQIPEDLNEVSLIMTSKWGCDGASDQSEYKQKFSDGTTSDSSIFMMSMVPITLEQNNTNPGKIIWSNPQSGSTRYCRVISFEYVKETPESTHNKVSGIQSEIEKLLPTSLEISGKIINVTHSLHLTMVDGKVIQTLTDTPSSASCVICKALPSQMNNLNELSKKTEIAENLKYGLSSLHAWIRFMECILHIAYRLDFCRWSARSTEEKEQMKSSKNRIQKLFKDETGLLVDYPKQGAGSSNDGNTARRFFRDPELTSKITGVNKQLIIRFGIILQTLACGMKIDTIKFKQYATETLQLYITLYDWYYMPASVHKILYHGHKIIEHFSLIPIGLLSEESQESRNKDFKHYRKFNTRKCTRVATNTDLIHKLLISSDPYISSLRFNMRNTKLEIDKDAKNMLMQE